MKICEIRAYLLFGKNVQVQYRNMICELCLCHFVHIHLNNPDVEQVNFILNLLVENDSPTSNVSSPDICYM